MGSPLRSTSGTSSPKSSLPPRSKLFSAWSRSPSVAVATTASTPLARGLTSSAPPGVPSGASCSMARTWSSVTSPVLSSMLTVSTTGPVAEPARPSTTPAALVNSSTLSPVAMSTRPLSAPSVTLRPYFMPSATGVPPVVIFAPSAPKFTVKLMLASALSTAPPRSASVCSSAAMGSPFISTIGTSSCTVTVNGIVTLAPSGEVPLNVTCTGKVRISSTEPGVE